MDWLVKPAYDGVVSGYFDGFCVDCDLCIIYLNCPSNCQNEYSSSSNGT